MMKTGMKAKMSYGLGSLAITVLYLVFQGYWASFFISKTEMGAAARGSIYMVSGVAGVTAMLLAGALTDRGKARPYILWMTALLAASGPLMFAAAGGSGIWGYVSVSCLFSAVLMAVFIFYIAMLSGLSEDSEERLSFSMFYVLGIGVGMLISKLLNGPLLESVSSMSGNAGYIGVTAACGTAGAVLLFICFQNIRECDVFAGEKASFAESVRASVKVKEWLLLLLLFFVGSVGFYMQRAFTVYYLPFCVDDSGMAEMQMSFVCLIGIPAAFLVMAALRRREKRNCLLLGIGIYCIGLLGAFLSGKYWTLLIISSVVWTTGAGIMCMNFLAMAADALDVTKRKTGVRPRGLFVVIILLVLKVGRGFSGTLSGMILNYGGYAAGGTQPETVLPAIRAGFIWIPMVLFALCSIINIFYDLNRGHHK